MSQNVSHIALFASDEGSIQTTGVSAEDFAVKPVTKRMAALLASGVTPKSWVEVDGVVDCKVDYAVFSHRSDVWIEGEDGESEQVDAYFNVYGEAMESENGTQAAYEALDEIGLDQPAEYVAVAYPRVLRFKDVFEAHAGENYTVRPAFADMIFEEDVEVVGDDD